MHPAYRWTDSYPYHTNPTAKQMDHGMNSPYYPWPYASNHYHPIPQSCHSCCNHTYFGGPGPYSYPPSYPHYPPPPPPPPSFHTHGFYPPFPGAHPAYSFPPPHYSTEPPRYDYDKNTPTHHCCGCDKKSTVQPQEPEVERKTSESLVPFFKDGPYPIMWVPPSYMNTESNAKVKENQPHDPVLKPLEHSKENDKITQNQQEEIGNHFPFPIFWLPSKNNEVKKDINEDNLDERKRKNDEVESEESDKHGVQKVIPVKQLESKEEKAPQQKTLKLPPVCLRIDPLPKKKNSSRSPSPPGDKKRSNGSAIEDSKSFKQQKTESSEGLKYDSKKVEKDSVNVDPFSEKGVEKGRSNEAEGPKVEKMKKLSENEAVLRIQSVYRGFEVRKSQPLMKLREIAKVGKQVVELRKRIQDLESLFVDDKQKLVIGESIMSLLLKLDTIQGLHPVVRDIRKSVAKELVGLQEKLDSLTIVNQSQTLSKQTTGADEEDQTLAQPQATVYKDNGGEEARDTNLQTQQVESHKEEKTSELNNNDQMELDQPVVNHEIAQSETDGHEVENADPTNAHLVEQSSGELDNDQVQMVVEIDDDVIKEKSDQVPTSMELEKSADQSIRDEKAQSDEAVRLGMVGDEVDAADPPTQNTMPEILVEQLSGEFNKDQVEIVAEAEKLVNDVVQEKSDRAESESDMNVETDVCERDGGTEAHDINLGPQVKSEGKQGTIELANDQPEMVEEINPPAEEDKPDQKKALIFTNVDSVENLTTAVDLGTVEVGKNEVNLEEAPIADDVDGSSKEVLMEDVEGVVPLSATGSHESSGGDRKVMEENEKLRMALEELMKAGNEQVGVIRELTGRVKDLEKKLSKKKTKKVKKSSRRTRGSLVEEELKSCA